uniref:Uncharacterized protein n=1 Tax=Plectus sambesii TaxID=2011161 RepID=A0A914VL42_9BILA
MGEEISLLLAHIVILCARTPTLGDGAAFCDENATNNPIKISDDQCRGVAVILHYLFGVHFSFLFLEGLNNYSINTFIANGTSLTGRFKNILIGICVPAIPVLLTALTNFKTYIHESTCWCNMNAVNFYAELLPAALICVPAMVLSEATGMGKYKENPKSLPEKRSSAYTSSRGALVVIPLSFAAWLVGMAAVDRTDLSLYSACSILNTILG